MSIGKKKKKQRPRLDSVAFDDDAEVIESDIEETTDPEDDEDTLTTKELPSQPPKHPHS